MKDIYFNFLTCVAIEDFEFARELFRLMALHLPEALPERYDITEPPKHQFDSKNLDPMKKLWEEELFWEGREPRTSGGVAHRNSVRHAMIDCSLEFDVSAKKNLTPFLIAVSQYLVVDYSCIHPAVEKCSEEDDMLAGVTTFHLRDSLPGIPWACCYGRPYVELFGKEKLLTQPIFECRELESGLIYSQLTESIADMFDDTESVAYLRNETKKHLGAECFWGSTHGSIRRAPRFATGNASPGAGEKPGPPS